MQNRDNDDFSGADKVALWLSKRGVTSQEFQRDPGKWISLAIKALKTDTDQKVIDEAAAIGGSATASIKGYFGGSSARPKRRKVKKTKRN